MNIKSLFFLLITFQISLYSMDNHLKKQENQINNRSLDVVANSRLQKLIIDYFGNDEWQIIKEFNTDIYPYPNSLTFLLNDKYLAFGDSRGDAFLLDLESGITKKILDAGDTYSPCNSLTYLPDTEVNKVSLEVIPEKNLQQIIRGYLKNEQILYDRENNTSQLVDINNLEKISPTAQFKEKSDWPARRTISADGKYLAYGFGQDLKVLDLKTQSICKILNGFVDILSGRGNQPACIMSTAFSPCEKYIVSGNSGGKIRIWNIDNIDNAKCVFAFDVHDCIESVSWLSNKNLIALSTLYKELIYDISDLFAPIKIKEISYGYLGLNPKIIEIPGTNICVFTRDSNNGVSIWDFSNTKNITISTLIIDFKPNDCCISSDGHYLAVISRLGKLIIFENKAKALLR